MNSSETPKTENYVEWLNQFNVRFDTNRAIHLGNDHVVLLLEPRPEECLLTVMSRSKKVGQQPTWQNVEMLANGEPVGKLNKKGQLFFDHLPKHTAITFRITEP